MPISQSQYIDITSGVGGNGAVRRRDLITRIFTENPLAPTGQFLEFTTLESVGAYFGTTSEEYHRAAFYFGWVSKNITQPEKISFARWANVATAPQIFGDEAITQSLGSWTSITSGSFILTIGSNTFTLSGLNFSSDASLAAVAATIQAAIRAESGGGVVWTSATVSFDSTRGTFDFTGGSTGFFPISVAAGPSNDIAAQLGWISAGTIISAGAAAQTLTQVLTSSASLSNNFGSFLFIPTLNLSQVEEVSIWTDDQNDQFMYLVPSPDSGTSSTYWADLQTYSGVGVTLAPTAGQYDEMVPGIILAATDYTAQNSVQNYMFQLNFPGLTAKVTDTQTAIGYDNIRTNYYGNTQTAGQVLNFYQRGTLMGGTTDATDMNTFANEMWLKDAAAAAILTLLLSLSVVSANTQGRAQVLGVLQSVVDAALFNGVISVGKTLTTFQQLYITTQTGSPVAWRQVQTIGYWLDAVVESYVTQDGRTEYKIVYTLIYSKDDAVRFVQGTHILI